MRSIIIIALVFALVIAVSILNENAPHQDTSKTLNEVNTPGNNSSVVVNETTTPGYSNTYTNEVTAEAGKPSPSLAYALSKGISDPLVLEVIRGFDSDEIMDAWEKETIDVVSTLPNIYQLDAIVYAVDNNLSINSLRVIEFYKVYPLLTDTLVKKIGDPEIAFYILNSYSPYLEYRVVSEKVLANYISRDPELFKVKEYAGPLADPDEDNVSNIEEMKFGSDLFLGISVLNWSPTRIVNDKVYDAQISVKAKSLRGITSAELLWIPKYYPHLPREAFPNETSREYDLVPMNGTLLESIVNVTGIKGGREYIVSVRVADRSGSVIISNLTTPYIREFENIAPLDNITVIVPYYMWYRMDLSNWREGHKYMPLLGEYRSNDPLVISKHIDWATGHGIDVFAVSWIGYEGGDLRYFDDNLKLLFNNPLSKDIKIAILYESPGRLKTTNNPQAPWEKNISDPDNIKILVSDFEYLSRNYFGKENYFKINNKPFLYIYDSSAFIGDVKAAIGMLREHVKSISGYDVYLVSDHVHPHVLPGSNSAWEERARTFDGITSWLGGYSGKGEYLGGNYEEQLKILYSEWGKWAIGNSRKLIPFTTPEFDNRYVSWGDPTSIPLERLPEIFKERLSIIISYSCYPKILMIGTFNDFFESTALEPTREYGFTYLQLLREMLENLKLAV